MRSCLPNLHSPRGITAAQRPPDQPPLSRTHTRCTTNILRLPQMQQASRTGALTELFFSFFFF